MTHLRIASGLAALSLLAACASPPQPQPQPIRDDIQYARGDQLTQLCFSRQFRSFTPYSSHELILRLRNGREYLLSTSLCQELEEAHSISLGEAGCLDSGDTLSVQARSGGPPRGQPTRHCRVLTIHEWLPGSPVEKRSSG